MDINDVKEGDRVRVTFEGRVVTNGTGSISIGVTGDQHDTVGRRHYFSKEAPYDTLYQFEKLFPEEPGPTAVIVSEAGTSKQNFIYKKIDGKWFRLTSTGYPAEHSERSWESLYVVLTNNAKNWTVYYPGDK